MNAIKGEEKDFTEKILENLVIMKPTNISQLKTAITGTVWGDYNVEESSSTIERK